MNIENEGSLSKPKVPIPTRWDIVHFKRLGYTGVELSEMFSVSPSTCNRIYNKWLQTGDVKDLERSGRPLVTTLEEEKTLIDTVEAHPEMTISHLLEESKIDISNTTGWRRLKDNGYRSRTSSIKWFISEEDRKERLKWAMKYIHMPENFWKRIVFTDECLIQFNTKKQKLWLYEDKIPGPVERDRWQASIMIWGAIKYNKISILEVIDGTMNSGKYHDILTRRLLKNLPGLKGSSPLDIDSDPLIYQHDNPYVHRANVIKRFFQERDIYVFPWPNRSPDLNLIESVWAKLKDGLKRSYDSSAELKEDVINAWDHIPSEFIENLYDSMKSRIQSVIDNKGGPTHY